MKKLYTLIITTIILASCQQKDQNKLSEFEIPELLDRTEKLQYFNEWSEIRNSYASLRHNINHDKKTIMSLINLSNLFIAEARVTGEHGHYYNAALKLINRVLNDRAITSDEKFLALSSKASVELSLHDFKNGLETAQTALALNPYNAKVYGSLVDAYVELGDYDKAVELADKMVSVRPDLRSYSRVSYLREIFGMVNESIVAMKMAVEAGSPGSEEKSWAALQLAELHSRYNKWNEAESILNQLLTERPDYPFAIAALAEVYTRQGKYREAETALTEACKIIPEVGFYVQLAQLYKEQGRTKEMESLLTDILQMLDEDTSHGHNMSLEYANIYLDFYNDAENALKYIRKDLNMRPENIDINILLSKIYIANKDRRNAQICLDKASRTNSQNPELDKLKVELELI